MQKEKEPELFNDIQRKKFKIYLDYLTKHPRPIDDQPHKFKDGKLWCEDYKIIELCKYMYLGAEAYLLDPPPNRLKNNPLWSNIEIMHDAEALMQTLQNPEAIIGHFQTLRELICIKEA